MSERRHVRTVLEINEQSVGIRFANSHDAYTPACRSERRKFDFDRHAMAERRHLNDQRKVNQDRAATNFRPRATRQAQQSDR